ncbi:hypothetical protein [Brevibacterium aurantiacum]|uniref:hypothetical protein n=1 Tax=Brevibacterium aurantiacum TaxID=273384 RepID=UPI0013DD9658|nr:hypothetical protein [Brevibacterium aurantiacum]MDN5551622.1 hypothetical protein [Brevibacterium sp.]
MRLRRAIAVQAAEALGRLLIASAEVNPLQIDLVAGMNSAKQEAGESKPHG